MKQRILTGIVLVCLVALPFYLGGAWFSSFALLTAFLAYTEWLKMAKITSFRFISASSLCALIGLFATVLFLEQDTYLVPILSMMTLLYLLTIVFHSSFTIEQAGVGLIGLLYIGVGFLSLAELRVDQGLIWTMSILSIIVSTDTGAYFIGKKWGKQKLAQKVSPNKTIEGAVGGTLVAILFAIFLQSAFQPFDSYVYTLFFTLLISVSGQVGDLVESAIKRHYGVKDSGKILPGHGGVLDRTDSWIFVFIVLSILQFV